MFQEIYVLYCGGNSYSVDSEEFLFVKMIKVLRFIILVCFKLVCKYYLILYFFFQLSFILLNSIECNIDLEGIF